MISNLAFKLNFKPIRLAVTAVLLSMALFSCGSKNNQSKDDPILNAYRLIDEHRTDEAIALLETSLEKQPSSYDYKAVLASAYAHKSGIRIQNLVPAIVQSDKLKNIGDKLPQFKNDKMTAIEGQQTNSTAAQSTAPTSVSASDSVNNSAKNIVTVLSRFAAVFDTYSSVPVIEKNQAIYLAHAIDLLNELGKQIKPEDALYRAVLELVMFKHIIAENLIGDFNEPSAASDQVCRIDLGNVNNTIVQLGKLVIDIYNDVGITQPKQADAMKSAAAKVTDLVSNFTIFTTTVTAADEAASILLKQAAIQNGFGKIITCGGT